MIDPGKISQKKKKFPGGVELGETDEKKLSEIEAKEREETIRKRELEKMKRIRENDQEALVSLIDEKRVI